MGGRGARGTPFISARLMTFLDTNFLVFALSPGTGEDQKLRGLLLAEERA